MLVLAVLAGVVVTSWPIGATYVHDRQRTRTAVALERDTVAQAPGRARRELARARAYNAHLRPAALRDPWAESGARAGGDRKAYLRQLAALRAMGTLSIPEIRVHLPIYHDATAETMAHGVGHFYGSSLPVGGLGTHAVLAGHTGMPDATLFDRLPELGVGDEFTVDVRGETLTYRVDRVVEVLPDELDEVAPVRGRDYVTLVTCTPPHVNTRRLLVRGARVPDAAAAPAASTVTGGADLTVRRWMIPRLAFSGAALAALALTVLGWAVGDRRRRRAGVPVGVDGAPRAPR